MSPTPSPAAGENAAPSGSPIYAYSFDGESYTGEFASIQEAALEGFAGSPDEDTIYIGELSVPYRIPGAKLLIEQVALNTAEEADGWADGYLENVPAVALKDLQDELQALWDRWEAKHDLAPDWFNVSNPHLYTRADLGVEEVGNGQINDEPA